MKDSTEDVMPFFPKGVIVLTLGLVTALFLLNGDAIQSCSPNCTFASQPFTPLIYFFVVVIIGAVLALLFVVTRRAEE